MMCAFFCFSPVRLVCVWQMALMILQYFFILAKLSSITCMPASSSHFLAYLVKAFFFEAALGGGKGGGEQEAKTHQLVRGVWPCCSPQDVLQVCPHNRFVHYAI